jgi:hypothetical protein
MNTETRSPKMTRTDTHKPSLLDPAEYSFEACFYQGDSDAMYDAYREDMKEYDAAVSTHASFDGNFTAKSTCDHCGANFNHGVLFLHIPTETLIHVGHICASDTIGLPSKAAASKKKAEKAQRAEAERIRRHKERAEWQAENTDVVDFLAAKANDSNLHPFLRDMVSSLHTWGSLFPRQADAVRKFIANENKPRPERPAEVEPTTPLIEGRRVITGLVVSAKIKESDFGTQYKWLVRETDGNKVWGSIPEAAWSAEGINSDIENFKGKTVTFTAAVERSRDDEHFGFYKRPTKIEVA